MEDAAKQRSMEGSFINLPRNRRSDVNSVGNVTYQGLTKETFKVSLDGLENYKIHLLSRDGVVPYWMTNEISKVKYILDNWQDLSNENA